MWRQKQFIAMLGLTACFMVFTRADSVVPQGAVILPKNEDAQIIHLLNRISFGPRPGDFQSVKAMGIDRYIQTQLSPASIPENPNLLLALARFQTLLMTPMQLLQMTTPPKPPPGQKQDPEVIKEFQKRANGVLDEASRARILRALYSQRQLQEVMTDFWFNHFNIFQDKGNDRIWIGAFETQAIEPYALGRFRDLLGATAHHPAMLVYLDNAQNHVNPPPKNNPNMLGSFLNPRIPNKASDEGLNENYAREIMELHTLGINGGYSQADVITLARILSGWGICNVDHPGDNRFGFCFSANRHDASPKVFLGVPIQGTGEQEGEQALDILAQSPATAHHISYQLAQYFVADNPPKTLVDKMSQRYLQTDGSIQEVLNLMFHSPEFGLPQNTDNKFKTPYQYIISTIRATGYPFNNIPLVLDTLRQMAMPLYGCLTPDGYKNTQDYWLNPDALLRRLSFSSALTTAHTIINIPSAKGAFPVIPAEKLDTNPAVLEQTLGNVFSDSTRNKIQLAPSGIQSSLILGSPEFMYR